MLTRQDTEERKRIGKDMRGKKEEKPGNALQCREERNNREGRESARLTRWHSQFVKRLI